MKTKRISWTENTLQEMALKTMDYSPREKLNVKAAYLQRVFEKVPSHISEEDWREFSLKSKELLELLPKKEEGKALQYRAYLKMLSNFRNYVRQKFHFVPKGFYLRIYIALGIILGLILGFFLKEMVICIFLGIGLGLVIGSYLDKKSARENKVL